MMNRSINILKNELTERKAERDGLQRAKENQEHGLANIVGKLDRVNEAVTDLEAALKLLRVNQGLVDYGKPESIEDAVVTGLTAN